MISVFNLTKKEQFTMQQPNTMKTTTFLTLAISFLFVLSGFTAPIEGTGTITFGKKSSTSCSGFGFCRMATDQSTSPKGEMNCQFKYDAEQRTFVVAIAHTEIAQKNPGMLQFFQNKSNVVLEEDFVLPPDVTTMLKANAEITIKKGQYTLVEKNSTYEIVISL
jgi:hypothetical protein